MPNSTLPPDDYLGDPQRLTSEFQDQINNLQNWVNTLQSELDALSSTTVNEGAVRDVGTSASNLVETSRLDTRLGTSGNLGGAALKDEGAGNGLNADQLDGIDSTGFLSTPGNPSNLTSLGFNTWRTPNASRPVLVLAQMSGDTDGTNSHKTRMEIDLSGGTTADYFIDISSSDANLPSGADGVGAVTAIIPPGASYQINLTFSGQNDNFDIILEWTL